MNTSSTPTGKDYQSYLRGSAWAAKRLAALNRAEHRCQVCYSNVKLQVHHRTYERLGDERPSDLTVLCDDCHAKFHEKMSRRRRRQQQRQEEEAARFDKRSSVEYEILRTARLLACQSRWSGCAETFLDFDPRLEEIRANNRNDRRGFISAALKVFDPVPFLVDEIAVVASTISEIGVSDPHLAALRTLRGLAV